jgi:hypothetical protein
MMNVLDLMESAVTKAELTALRTRCERAEAKLSTALGAMAAVHGPPRPETRQCPACVVLADPDNNHLVTEWAALRAEHEAVELVDLNAHPKLKNARAAVEAARGK